MSRIGWTWPLCRWCWERKNGEREPVHMIDPKAEVCAWCGNLTEAGIYVRMDPEKVRYPVNGDPE